ncbi:Zinc finger and SCAN domain-containing protein 32 [Amphibalanus amphitrite]|uniref:Zinc finger and SCAN domain-containing protein 32 n=1 Tax=Amphibalanus amphitrite TaxID=1232801 RepID=A0A6A4WE78_AMPAM|nr:Zinc finger and SCAN domain-containing protein 32 [Amphibalanus amphitrite]
MWGVTDLTMTPDEARAQPLPRLYECNLCGKTFNNRRRDRFLAHLRLHTGERPFKCLYSGRGFNRQDHVTVHMRLHTGGKPFQCIVCKHRFAKQQELKSHACVGPMMPPENGITITPTSAVDFRTFRVRNQLNGSPSRAESGD